MEGKGKVKKGKGRKNQGRKGKYHRTMRDLDRQILCMCKKNDQNNSMWDLDRQIRSDCKNYEKNILCTTCVDRFPVCEKN